MTEASRQVKISHKSDEIDDNNHMRPILWFKNFAFQKAAWLYALAVLLLLQLSACPKESAPQAKVMAEDAGAPSVDEIFARSLTSHRRLNYRADLREIRKRKVLRVLLLNNSTSHFLFRGDELGFEYELALNLAKELGLRLEVVPATTRRDLVPMLLDGRADVIGVGLSHDSDRSQRVSLCTPYMKVKHQVVVRKNRPAKISQPADLLKEIVYVNRDSSSFKKLRALGQELGQTIPIAATAASEGSEDLFDKVAIGLIPVTVARSNQVAAELTWRNDIEVAFDLPEEESLSWAVRDDSPKLNRAVNAFFRRHHRDLLFNTLYNKYFRNPKRALTLRDENLRADLGGTLSPYDDLLQKTAERYQLDWRLLAAQAYQESRFDPKAKSWAGAQGLMQIMPKTAQHLGLKNPANPMQNLDAGAHYLRQLIDRFSADLPLKERIRFALAAYNCGYGHVRDARRLAKWLGLDPNRWFGQTEKAMLRLSKERFYLKAKHGYVRGSEPVNYVSQIQTRYDAYVSVIASK